MPDRVPVVSVLMANRDGAAYVEAAIRSLLDQTLDDLEIIVADDASRDDSVARVRRMAERDPRVRVLTAETAGGPAAARNRALRA
ncbi:glycosyltransferase, partial [Caulobacter sp. 17J65-9]|uniref:glycosyltransferase family 2 protein n=1 Tax=Caulobacter sp. 17J65-9 TaxID=2709382 RepID=UPI0013CAE85B